MHPSELYFQKLGAAFVRGRQIQGVDIGLANDLFATDLNHLMERDVKAILQAGGKADLRIHKFKRTMALPRVHRVLGIPRSLVPARVLDIGSGRGTFLWPLLDTFLDLTVLAVDHDAVRARDIQAVRLGGIERLLGLRMDLADTPDFVLACRFHAVLWPELSQVRANVGNAPITPCLVSPMANGEDWPTPDCPSPIISTGECYRRQDGHNDKGH